MGDRTKISWATSTLNPWVGCDPISTGCRSCYAARMAARFCGTGERYEGLVDYSVSERLLDAARGRDSFPRFNGKLMPNPEVFEKPIHWKRPRVIFVCSMSDPFHEKVPKEWFDRLMNVVQQARQHTYLFLTKRPENIPEGFPWGMEHVWTGVTAENRVMADRRVALLLKRTEARSKRFMSCEPLLGPIFWDPESSVWPNVINWIIAGGESGPGFRPMDEGWVRGLRDMAKDVGIPFHYKQDAGVRPNKLPMLDGKVWDERPDFWSGR